jgi:hypothetical protein
MIHQGTPTYNITPFVHGGACELHTLINEVCCSQVSSAELSFYALCDTRCTITPCCLIVFQVCPFKEPCGPFPANIMRKARGCVPAVKVCNKSLCVKYESTSNCYPTCK